MESALPSASESGLDEVDNSAIRVGVGAKAKKRKPKSKYTDEDRYKIAKDAKDHGPNRAAKYFQSKYPTIRKSTVKSFLKKYNEQVRIKKTLTQPLTERITNFTWGRSLMVGPVIDEKKVDILVTELYQQLQMFYSAEVKICSSEILKQHQCGDVVSSKDLDFGCELQQPEKWKSLKEQEKKEGSSIILKLLTV